MHTLSINELAAGLRAKKFSSRELTQAYLKRIDAHDGAINAYVTVTAERALRQADAADARLAELHGRGVQEARLYGRDPDDGVGGDGAFFLLLDEPEVYGLPPDPIVTTRDLPEMWRNAALTAVGLGAAVLAAFWGGRK